MQETWVPPLGQEDCLEEEMVNHSCLENPHGQRSLAGYSPWGHKESDAMELTHNHILRKLPFMGNVVLDVSILSNSLLSRKLFRPEEC